MIRFLRPGLQTGAQISLADISCSEERRSKWYNLLSHAYMPDISSKDADRRASGGSDAVLTHFRRDRDPIKLSSHAAPKIQRPKTERLFLIHRTIILNLLRGILLKAYYMSVLELSVCVVLQIAVIFRGGATEDSEWSVKPCSFLKCPPIVCHVYKMLLVCRHGDPLPSEVFDHEEGAQEEQVGNLEEGEDLYPVSSQWGAKHEEKVNKASPLAAITEKVILTFYGPLRIGFFFRFESPSYFTTPSLFRSTRRRAWSARCRRSAARWFDPKSAVRTSASRTRS